MAQWVKNPTAEAQVIAEVWVQSPTWSSGLKDLALPQLWHRLQLWLGFKPWSGNFHIPQVWPQVFCFFVFNMEANHTENTEASLMMVRLVHDSLWDSGSLFMKL